MELLHNLHSLPCFCKKDASAPFIQPRCSGFHCFFTKSCVFGSMCVSPASVLSSQKHASRPFFRRHLLSTPLSPPPSRISDGQICGILSLKSNSRQLVAVPSSALAPCLVLNMSASSSSPGKHLQELTDPSPSNRPEPPVPPDPPPTSYSTSHSAYISALFTAKTFSVLTPSGNNMSSPVHSPSSTRAPMTTTLISQRSEAHHRRLFLLTISNPPQPPDPPDPPPVVPPDPPPLPRSPPLLHGFSLSKGKSRSTVPHLLESPLRRLMSRHLESPFSELTQLCIKLPLHVTNQAIISLAKPQQLRLPVSVSRNGNWCLSSPISSSLQLQGHIKKYDTNRSLLIFNCKLLNKLWQIKLILRRLSSFRHTESSVQPDLVLGLDMGSLFMGFIMLAFKKLNKKISQSRNLISSSTCIISTSQLCYSGLFFVAPHTFDFAQGSITHQFISSALMAKAIALKTAFEAALFEIHHLRVFSDSQPLVSLIISNDDDNELKSVLLDTHCLLETFSSILISFIFRLEYVSVSFSHLLYVYEF